MEGKGKRVRLGGQDFIEIDRADLPFCENEPRGTLVLMPYHPPDDKLEFPTAAPLEDAKFFLGSGIATHRRIWNWDRADKHLQQYFDDPETLEHEAQEGLRACQLEVFTEDDWYGECFSVMWAHGWLDRRGDIAAHIVQHVVGQYGQKEIDDAKERYGDAWSAYVAELAAIRLAAPLSRLWYAVNMKSLYYIHHDDLRLGYLWAEYRMRLRHEQDSFRGKKNIASARDGGELRAKYFQARSRNILERMAALVESGMSVSNAAHRVAKAGFGTSAEANRKLWSRHRKK